MNILSALVFAMMVTSVTAAQAEGESALFDNLDINKDGQITVFEAEGDMDVLERFNQLDSNRDGVLNREEFAAFKKPE